MSKFDIEKVVHNFKNSLHEEYDVKLSDYLDAYDELSRLFADLGMVFGFIDSDVSSKKTILRELIKENKDGYSTVTTMVSTECNDTNTPKEKGSRTLLRLHRALNFLMLFTEQISAKENESTSEVFNTCYKETLHRHHSWIVRKTVAIASTMVPSRERLLDIFFHNDNKLHDAKHMATVFLEVSSEVYQRIQLIYEEKGILYLP